MITTEESGLLEGFIVRWNRTIMSLLQFVNDTIFFFRASLENLQKLKLILLVFGEMSGLKINLQKSTLSGINIS